MKTIHLAAVLGVLATVIFTAIPARAADNDGVALAIVYDTSGSMKEEVRDGAGNLTPKYVIANRALENIADKIQTYATNAPAGVPRNIQAGLFIFDGANVKPAVKFGPFDAAAFKDWARKFSSPDGGTPLGHALAEAGKTVLNSGLARKHVLIITDGINTLGPPPAKIMPQLRQQAEAKQAEVSIHFVAFDVAAGVFDPVKRLGASVVAAADETQLNTQLNFILQQEILLEKEEPKK